MTAMSRPTLAEIKKSWPPAIDVAPGALAFGVSRSSAYEAIRNGTFPAKTIKVGSRIKILTASLVEVLEGNSDAPAAG